MDDIADNSQGSRLFSRTLLGFAAGILGLAACVCGFYSLVGEIDFARLASVPFAIASAACAMFYIIGFRRRFTELRKAKTHVSNNSQKRETTMVSWAVVCSCIGLCLSLLTLSWLFL